MKKPRRILCLLGAASRHAEARPGGRERLRKREAGQDRREPVTGLQTASLQPSSGLTASTSLSPQLSTEDWRKRFLIRKPTRE